MLNNVIAHFIQEFYGKDILCYCQILAREKKFKTNEDEPFLFGQSSGFNCDSHYRIGKA